MLENNTLSALIKNQFPSIYKEEGDNLIIFLENYYKFLEEGYLDKSFKLRSYSDIDETIDSYVKRITDEFMAAIPENIAADRRLLQKHILDLYRAKGSATAISLMFKILYNEDIEIYLPEKDILKASSGKWFIPKYIEIEYKPSNTLLQGQLITGVNTNSTAVVSSYIIKNIGGKIYSILYIENIGGEFEVGELINCDAFTIQTMRPLILGSAKELDVLASSPGFKVGEIIKPFGEEIHDETLLARVSKVKDIDSGIITPAIVYGGNGYSINASVTITDNTNINGSDFDVEVGSIINVTNLYTSNTLIEPYANVSLNATSFGMANAAANVDTIINDSLNFYSIEIGTIETLRVLNPGINYDGSVNIKITEPWLNGYTIVDGGTGGLWGNNANISGEAAFGTNAIANVAVVSAGLGYKQDQIVTFQSVDDFARVSSIKVNLNYNGVEEGSYLDDNGFLSSQKKLRDSYYYQEFSYEIRSSKTLEKYVGILKKLAHPAGNEIFGKYLFKE